MHGHMKIEPRLQIIGTENFVKFVRVVFSKRQRITLRLLYAIGRPSVVCRL